MTQNIKIVEKNVYGNTLIYPACETSKKLADLLKTKTFNHYQLCKIEALGYVIENVTPKIILINHGNYIQNGRTC